MKKKEYFFFKHSFPIIKKKPRFLIKDPSFQFMIDQTSCQQYLIARLGFEMSRN
jgi:hypothetical protein